MREIVHIQAGQCGNQIGAKVRNDHVMIDFILLIYFVTNVLETPRHIMHNIIIGCI